MLSCVMQEKLYFYFDVVKIFQTIKQKEHCEDETPEIKESF